jgi:hypothetical protein
MYVCAWMLKYIYVRTFRSPYWSWMFVWNTRQGAFCDFLRNATLICGITNETWRYNFTIVRHDFSLVTCEYTYLLSNVWRMIFKYIPYINDLFYITPLSSSRAPHHDLSDWLGRVSCFFQQPLPSKSNVICRHLCSCYTDQYTVSYRSYKVTFLGRVR